MILLKAGAFPTITQIRGLLLLEPTTDFFYRINNDNVRNKIEDKKRRKLRQRVVKLPPSPHCCKESIKAHVLLGKSQIEMAICTCKALNVAIGVPVSYVFHDDGSLTKNNNKELLFQFPGSLIVDRIIADKIANDKLMDYPVCKFVREKNVLMLKLFDVFFWSDNDNRVAYIDSDIIFFKKPEQYINELKNVNGNNFFNKDIGHGCFYSLNGEELRSITGSKVIPQINTGLWILNKSVLNIDLVEKWLSAEFIQQKLSDHFLEQTLIAMLASVNPQEGIYFNEQYDVSLDKDLKEAICKHYVSTIRKDYELEGLKFLLQELNFGKKWKQFVRELNAPN